MKRTTRLSLCCGLLASAVCKLSAADVAIPEVTDEHLELSLLASEPDIVTPTGLTADRHGRLFVAETNTHARHSQYQGYEYDRILAFSDASGDGNLDASAVYADRLKNVLALAVGNDDALYVLQMKDLLRLRDTDRDGRCDTRETLLSIETENNNNHGVFLALAVDDSDRIYVTLGNIGGSSYTISGSDGSSISGQGDTGLIVRCDGDGRDVRRFAHGFWNPCDLKFDAFGRLLATDNDPDSRGPNRVLHVIRGGRYGYGARFGPSGLHPYQAWDGELPGTLPMLAGVGEAPVGVLDCNASSLPRDYENDLLVCVWGTNQVVRVRTRAAGVTRRGDVGPLVHGDRGFRPTGITTTADGTIYFGDWADRRYPVHGKGRIWKLAVRPGVDRLTPSPAFSRTGRDAGQQRLREIDRVSMPTRSLFAAATDADPFVASAAIERLSEIASPGVLVDRLSRPEPAVRLAALLALRHADYAVETKTLSTLLEDPDPQLRRTAMIVAGESKRWEMATPLQDSMAKQTTSSQLFETFLATHQLLSELEKEHVRRGTRGTQIDRSVDQTLVRRLLADAEQSAELRAMAARYLSKPTGQDAKLLLQLAASGESQLARSALYTLMLADERFDAGPLYDIAKDVSKPPVVRRTAIMTAASLGGPRLHDLVDLLGDEQVAATAARGLTQSNTDPKVVASMEKILGDKRASDDLADQARFALQREANRPKSAGEWLVATEGGDPDAGRLVFYDSRFGCAKCHRYEGRGGIIGPDLTGVSAAKTREQILNSILDPSLERSPDYQGYVVLMQNGQIHQGTQFHFRGESADLLLISGQWIRFKLDETEEYRALDVSLMPDNLVDAMSVPQLRDLVAFLAEK